VPEVRLDRNWTRNEDRRHFQRWSERHCPNCEHYFSFVAYPSISESLTDPRAPEEDRLFAEVVMQAVAELKADEAIARAGLSP
jgi:hypothetical protein